MPFYNGARYAQSAIDSIVAQSSPPLELIVVNDGSHVEAAQIIHELVAAVSPVLKATVIDQENLGQSAARNAGALAAKGELLAFIDQDDLWHPEHLARLAADFEGDAELGWTYSDFSEIDSNGLLMTREFIRHQGSTHPKTSVHELIAEDVMVLPSASVIRKTAFTAVGGFDPRLRGYEDDDLFVRMFQGGWTSRFYPESLASFRVHRGSSSDKSLFRDSRMIYFHKLVEQFPDDHRRHRFFVSHVIVPRMVRSTLSEYSHAVQSKLYREAREIAGCIATITKAGSRVTGRQRLGLMILHRPRLSRALINVNRSLPRFLRSRAVSVLLPRY